MLVDSIEAHHLGRWQRERLAADAKPATVNREWSVMKAVLNFGEAKELIERNPIRGAVKLLKADNMRTAFFEPEEWRAFITAFDDPEAWRLYLGDRCFTRRREGAKCSPLLSSRLRAFA